VGSPLVICQGEPAAHVLCFGVAEGTNDDYQQVQRGADRRVMAAQLQDHLSDIFGAEH
jgi:hypothetical protein